MNSKCFELFVYRSKWKSNYYHSYYNCGACCPLAQLIVADDSQALECWLLSGSIRQVENGMLDASLSLHPHTGSVLFKHTQKKNTSKLAEGALAMLAPHELPFKAFLACWFEFGFTIMSLSALDILKSITVNRHSGVVGPTRN